MHRVLRLLCFVLLLLCLVTGALAVDRLRGDAAVEDRGSVTEGAVTEVRQRALRDQVVVSLDGLDGRPITVTKDGPVRVGDRLVVQYDPDGAVTEGKVAGSTRDRDDARAVLAGAAVLLVLVAAVTPWRSRAGRERRAQRVLDGA